MFTYLSQKVKFNWFMQLRPEVIRGEKKRTVLSWGLAETVP